MDIVKFKGKKYCFVGDVVDGVPQAGAIATKEQYSNGKCSYAHLNSNGIISRFNKQIGKREDLEYVGTKEVDIKEGAFRNLFNWW